MDTPIFACQILICQWFYAISVALPFGAQNFSPSMKIGTCRKKTLKIDHQVLKKSQAQQTIAEHDFIQAGPLIYFLNAGFGLHVLLVEAYSKACTDHAFFCFIFQQKGFICGFPAKFFFLSQIKLRVFILRHQSKIVYPKHNRGQGHAKESQPEQLPGLRQPKGIVNDPNQQQPARIDVSIYSSIDQERNAGNGGDMEDSRKKNTNIRRTGTRVGIVFRHLKK